MSVNPCRLANIADWTTAFPGVWFSGSSIGVDERFFACCSGTGQFESIDLTQTYHCDLKSRIVKLAKLYRFFKMRFREESQFVWSENQAQQIQLCLKTQKGFLKYRQNSDLLDATYWTNALAIAYRTNTEVHIIDWLSSSHAEDLPVEINRDKKYVFFLIGVDNLWKPQDYDRFDKVLSYAYNANIPVWVEMIQNSAPESKAKGLRARAIALKAKNPLDWLDSGLRAKLERLCRLGRQVERKPSSAKTQQSKPQFR